MLRRLAALLAVSAIVLAGCGTSSAPALTDPVDILQHSIAATQTLHSFHVHAGLSGSINADVTGSGKSTPLDLSGTTADADVDLANRALHLSASIPALLGATADIIVIGNDTYTKVSLLGPKYTHSTTSSALGSFEPLSPGALSSSGPIDPKQVGDQITAALGKLATPPKLGPDVQCGDTTCYDITISATSADLSNIAGASLDPSMSGSGTLEVQVRKSDLYPAKIVATVNGGSQGTLTVTVEFSAFNTPVTITAPPADQIEGS